MKCLFIKFYGGELEIAECKGRTYQRKLKSNRVRKIAEDLNMNVFGVVLISERDERCFIIDGQHRIEALKLRGITHVMCQILVGLTYEQEAREFERLNTERSSLTAIDKFNSAVESRDKDACKIVRILNKYGYSYPRQYYRTKDNVITSIGTIRDIHKDYGDEHLSKVLKVIRQSWNGNADSTSSSVLKGMSTFLYNYGEYVNEKILMESLEKITIEEVILQAVTFSKSCIRAIRGDGYSYNVAKVIRDVYNAEAKKN